MIFSNNLRDRSFMVVAQFTCCTAVIRDKSSVGFHLPRSLTEAGAGG